MVTENRFGVGNKNNHNDHNPLLEEVIEQKKRRPSSLSDMLESM